MQGRIFSYRTISRPLFLFIALGSIQWITIAELALSLKPMHIPFLYMSVRGYFTGKLSHFSSGWLQFLWVTFSIYMLVTLTSVMWSQNVGVGVTLTIKSMLYFSLSLGVALYLSESTREEIMKDLLLGGAASCVLFLAVAFISLSLKGVDTFGLVAQALRSGDPRILQFEIFWVLFNDPDARVTGEVTSTALRHTAFGFLFIGSISGLYYLARGEYIFLATFTIATSLILILLSVSRSLIIVSLLGLLISSIGLLPRRPVLYLMAAFVTITAAILGASDLPLRLRRFPHARVLMASNCSQLGPCSPE